MNMRANYTIICGMPRCGTRQFVDFLNRDERVCIQAEIRASLIPYISDLILKADNEYKSGKQGKYYLLKRYDALKELFSLFSKSQRVSKQSAIIHGFKTPNIEFYYKTLSSLFLPSVEKLTYFYCIRNLKDCYLSLSAMPWFKRTPEQFLSRYLKSLKTSTKINSYFNSTDSKAKIHILNLDAFIASEDKEDWIISNLFSLLGLELSSSMAKEYIATTENRNATIKATGIQRPKLLPDKIYKIFMERIDDINLTVTAFNKSFNSKLEAIWD